MDVFVIEMIAAPLHVIPLGVVAHSVQTFDVDVLPAVCRHVSHSSSVLWSISSLVKENATMLSQSAFESLK